MLKALATLLLLASFTASIMGCSIELFAGAKSNCNLETQAHCSTSDQNTETQSSDSNHHCLGCVHISFIDVAPSVISFLTIDSQIYSQYFFLYKNPTFDSLKRPPLAA